MEWISVKDKLPEDDNELTMFVEWHHDRSVQEFIGIWKHVKHFREWQLKYSFTHWTKISPPKPTEL